MKKVERGPGRRLGIALLVGLAAQPAVAMTPYLVRDIDTVRQEDGSEVGVLATFDNGTTLFAAHDDEGLDRELWASDGIERLTDDTARTPTRLWVQGFHRDTGFELWAVQPD